MDASFLRICAVPVLPAAAVDRLAGALAPFGLFVPVARADRDLDATIVELRTGGDAMVLALREGSNVLKEFAASRLLRFEVQSVTAPEAHAESELSTTLAELFEAPVYVARRDMPASQWIDERPIGFGVDGFAIRASVPTVAPRRARGRGVAVEFGAPTIAMKVALQGVPAAALRDMCDAAGSARGGLLHLGATPSISIASGEPVIILECSDAIKSPPARGVALLRIEAARYGGAVGPASLLSHISLAVLLGSLAENMQLIVEPAQVIETHVAAS